MEIILRPVVRRRVLDSMVYSGLDWLVVVCGWLLFRSARRRRVYSRNHFGSNENDKGSYSNVGCYD